MSLLTVDDEERIQEFNKKLNQTITGRAVQEALGSKRTVIGIIEPHIGNLYFLSTFYLYAYESKDTNCLVLNFKESSNEFMQDLIFQITIGYNATNDIKTYSSFQDPKSHRSAPEIAEFLIKLAEILNIDITFTTKNTSLP